LEKGSAATALTNCLMVNEQDLGSTPYVRVNRQYFLGTKYVLLLIPVIVLVALFLRQSLLTLRPASAPLPSLALRSDPSIPPGVVWASNPHRLWMGISMGEDIEVEPVELGGQGSWLASLDLEVRSAISFCFPLGR
jgi:hypothetical protein